MRIFSKRNFENYKHFFNYLIRIDINHNWGGKNIDDLERLKFLIFECPARNNHHLLGKTGREWSTEGRWRVVTRPWLYLCFPIALKAVTHVLRRPRSRLLCLRVSFNSSHSLVAAVTHPYGIATPIIRSIPPPLFHFSNDPSSFFLRSH